jgi:hypothetical protein
LQKIGASSNPPPSSGDVEALMHAVLYVGDQLEGVVPAGGGRQAVRSFAAIAGLAVIALACALAFILAPVGSAAWPFAAVALVAVVAIFGVAEEREGEGSS